MRPTVRYCIALGGLLLLASYSHSFPRTNDQIICNKIFSYAFEHKLIDKPIGDIMVEIGKQFLGKPYEPNTLDSTSNEQLTVNLHGFDCVTFVENVLALSRCIKPNRLSFEAFKQELQTIRYRNGIINGYPSRLHYFSDWIHDNQKKHLLEDKTKELGGNPFEKTINFMTAHRNAYPKLTDDSTYMVMKVIEDSINKQQPYFIPKFSIVNCQFKIDNGDIIAITTNRDGLDISHVGIAIRMKDGSLHYMHAPNVNGTVKISVETLAEHLKKNAGQTGIIVVRPVE